MNFSSNRVDGVSLIPGLGVRLFTIVLAGPTVLANEVIAMRSLFTAGALSVICYAKIHGTKHRPWLTALLARPGTKESTSATRPRPGFPLARE